MNITRDNCRTQLSAVALAVLATGAFSRLLVLAARRGVMAVRS